MPRKCFDGESKMNHITRDLTKMTRKNRQQNISLTPEKMIFKTPAGHKLINKQPLIIFNAISNKLYKIRVVELSQKVNFGLHQTNCHMSPSNISVSQGQSFISNNLLTQGRYSTNHPFSMALETIWL